MKMLTGMAIALALSSVLVLCFGGCSTPSGPPQQATLAPETNAKLEAVAETIDTINSKVEQIQLTVNNQTQNFQLDAERAKLQDRADIRQVRLAAAVLGMMIGLILVGLASPEIANFRIRVVLITLACILILAGAGASLWSVI